MAELLIHYGEFIEKEIILTFYVQYLKRFPPIRLKDSHERIKERRFSNTLRLSIFHNYVRPHEGLDGKAPAEACGIKVEGQDKWKTLIENASKRQNQR
jgi:hypothetical protein